MAEKKPLTVAQMRAMTTEELQKVACEKGRLGNASWRASVAQEFLAKERYLGNANATISKRDARNRKLLSDEWWDVDNRGYSSWDEH